MTDQGKPTSAPVSSVTSLDEIRQKAKENTEGKVIVLPSGIKLKIKRPSLSKLLRDRQIPQNLIGAAIRMTEGRRTSDDRELSENITLMEYVVTNAIVEPAGMTKEDVQSLSDEDKGMCFLYVQGEVSDLDSFRNKLT